MHATQCKKKDCKLLHCAELKMRNKRSRELQAQAKRHKKMAEAAAKKAAAEKGEDAEQGKEGRGSEGGR